MVLPSDLESQIKNECAVFYLDNFEQQGIESDFSAKVTQTRDFLSQQRADVCFFFQNADLPSENSTLEQYSALAVYQAHRY